MTIHVDIDDKSVDEFLDENKDTLFKMLNNVGLLKPNKKKGTSMNTSNWIELHAGGKGIIVAVNSIAVIEEDDNYEKNRCNEPNQAAVA